MKTVSFRRITVAAIAVAAILPVLSTQAATTTYPGSITITSPAPHTETHGTVPIDWRWRTGTYVKSTSRVDIATTLNGVQWTSVATNVPIRNGGIDWAPQTSAAIFAIRATVRGTSVKHIVGNILIDNVQPEVEITRPTATEVIVDDETHVSQRYIIGVSTVTARAFDAHSGIAKVEWFLNGTSIGPGTSLTHDFGATPGLHELMVHVTDEAGMTNEASIEFLAIPGPSNVGSVPSVPEVPEGPEVPEAPEAPEGPEVPEAPEGPEVPEPPVDPNNPPSVDPNNPPPLPEGLPTP